MEKKKGKNSKTVEKKTSNKKTVASKKTTPKKVVSKKSSNNNIPKENVKNLVILFASVIALLGLFIFINVRSVQENNNATNNSTEEYDYSEGEEILVGSNTLVVYFSNTGTTEEAAKRIRDIVNADLIELKPVNPYPLKYETNLPIAQKEQDENARPELKTTINDFEKYDVIYLGYPIWLELNPMLINTFLESYDFTDKTVIPFATSGSSEITKSVENIKKEIPNAIFKEGLLVRNTKDIEPWLKKIGMIE